MIPLLSFQSSKDRYAVKLAYLQKFLNFMEWSKQNVLDPNAKFKIGVISPNPLEKQLADFSNKHKIKGQSIVCVSIDNLSEMKGINLIYIPNGHHHSIEAIIHKALEEHILLIGERKGYAKKGVHINFMEEREYIRFEINKSVLERDGYVMAPVLLKVAKVVD